MNEERIHRLKKIRSDAYGLVNEMEDQLLDCTDSKKKRSLNREIEETRELIKGYEEELAQLDPTFKISVSPVADRPPAEVGGLSATPVNESLTAKKVKSIFPQKLRERCYELLSKIEILYQSFSDTAQLLTLLRTSGSADMDHHSRQIRCNNLNSDLCIKYCINYFATLSHAPRQQPMLVVFLRVFKDLFPPESFERDELNKLCADITAYFNNPAL